MTLLLAARGQSHILLTADGRCMNTCRGVRATTSDTLQKIFPVAGRPLAFVHHGENVINGQSVSAIVDAIVQNNHDVISTATLREISLLLGQDLNAEVTQTLTRIADSKTCGFWVCGFDPGICKPQIYEVIWHKGSNSSIELLIMPHGDLLMGGDAAQPIKNFLAEPIDARLSWNRILTSDVQYSQELHDELFRRAESAQTKNETDLFGGHKHRLVVTSDGCNWLLAPMITRTE